MADHNNDAVMNYLFAQFTDLIVQRAGRDEARKGTEYRIVKGIKHIHTIVALDALIEGRTPDQIKSMLYYYDLASAVREARDRTVVVKPTGCEIE
jgi:hypothetical protein